MDSVAPVPDDFVAFVAANDRRLRAACRTLTSNSHLADSVALELLAGVALRWRRVRRRDPDGGAHYLDRLIRRETRAWRGLRPADDAPRAARRSGRIAVVTDAGATPGSAASAGATRRAMDAWDRARRIRLTRRLVAAAGVAVVSCFGAVGPRAPAPTPDTVLPIPVPTAVPAGVRILPEFTRLADLVRTPTVLAEQLAVDPGGAAELASRPVTRALALHRQSLGPLLVLGEDGATRRVDDATIAGARLLSTSLSPDGTRAALVTPEQIHVVNLTTGAVRSVASPQDSGPGMPRALAWPTPHSVLVPGRGGGKRIDVDTGAVTEVRGVTGLDVTAVQGPPLGRLVELLPTGQSGGRPPRIRVWRTDATAPASAPTTDIEDRTIFGPPWVGLWLGAGWSTVDLFVRGCDPAAIPMPATLGRATAAVAAIGANGIVMSTLISVDASDIEVLGFIDGDTVMVNVSRAPSASIIVAWKPRTGALQRVTAMQPLLQVSLANLLAPT
jgi:hypothetical protein